MDELVAFLKDRLQERRALIEDIEKQRADYGEEMDGGWDLWGSFGTLVSQFCDFKAALADVDAKLKIIGMHVPDQKYCTGDSDLPEAWHVTCKSCGGSPYDYPVDWPCDTIRALALPYQSHSLYQESWKPA